MQPSDGTGTPASSPPPAAAAPPVVEVETVIVGASAAGLAVAAALQRAGRSFVLLEQGPDVATTWRRHYDRLRLHTPRWLSGLPRHPFPRSAGRYPSRDQVVAYLEDYAARFQLQPLFGREVSSVREDQERHWTTRTRDGACYHSHNVVLATGLAHRPHRPHWPGLETFGGPVLHSSEYRSGKPWAGRRVLVIGIGNSGGEIALDLWEQGAQPTLAVRGPLNVVPRDFLGISVAAWSVLLQALPVVIGEAISSLVARRQFASLGKLGLRRLPHGPLTQTRRFGRIPLVDVGTVARLRSGEIALRPAVSWFGPGRVGFSDGQAEPFDAVILATGYRSGLGALLGPRVIERLDEEGRPTVSGEELRPGLYPCGFRVTATGTLREIGREAKRIARSIARRG